ncbi:MAG TPA: FtsX-like permease family protein [Candidatus Binatia bacterium]|nr:FtsX-like permease family protein [Candidatus Binatia bacterium]
MTAALTYAFRRLRRGWRSGELLILSLAIAVAVAASGAVELFSGRVQAALAAQSGDALGADLAFTSRAVLPASLAEQVRAAGARTARVVNLPSVVFAGERSLLASVKAVEPAYPLRGAMRMADEPYAPERVAQGGPAPGEAWADARLWSELQVQRGATLTVGAIALTLTGVVTYEPDRGGGFADLAPRLLMNHADLAGTQLVQPGSRMQQWLLASGPPDALERVRGLPLPAEARRLSPAEARPELKSAMDRAARFLRLAVLAASLLSAAAVAICARAQGRRLRDEVALLKCLGARQRFVASALMASLLLVGLVAGLAGALAGWLAQAGLAAAAAQMLSIPLPAVSPAPLAKALLLGLVVLAGFALPPVLDARRAPPVRVFQRTETASRAGAMVPVGAALAVVALLWQQAGDVQLALYVLGGAAGTMLALALLAWALVALLAPLRRSVGTAWRFGLGNVARRRGASVVQAVALGQALLALLLLGIVRQDLLETWKARLSPETPNQFLINIQPAQIPAMQEFFAQRGLPKLEPMPMARGRLVALNGKRVTADSFQDPETQRWINRDFNLSWSDLLPDDNKLTAGQWWTAAQHGQKLLSADRYAVERLGLRLGDTVALAFADQELTFTVTSFREVEWDTFRPNFFLLAPPGALDAVPVSWLASFHLDAARKALLRDLTRQFPNVTALDVDTLITQVRAIVDRVVRGVEFILLFTLAAGLTVLLAAIEGTREDRVRESGLLRALGARTRVIVQGLLAEYAVLGLLAGSVAAIAAQLIAWALATQVMRIPYGPRPLLWLAGAGVGVVLVTALGWLSLRRTLRASPTEVLRAGA